MCTVSSIRSVERDHCVITCPESGLHPLQPNKANHWVATLLHVLQLLLLQERMHRLEALRLETDSRRRTVESLSDSYEKKKVRVVLHLWVIS